ncbi:MAG: hypothetical protein IPM95_15950 [Sphingobacteriales bacterium]|nr:hypothetical protein [Sphingobacteriales bacterium]
MDYKLLLHLHLGFAVLFFISYSIKSVLFLAGKSNAFLAYKKKTLIVETLLSVGFLVLGFWMYFFRIKWMGGIPAEMHMWLDSKVLLALAAIPLGIVGFKKENKVLVALSLLFFTITLVLGLMHYQ